MYIAILHSAIIGKHTLDAKGLLKRIKPKRRVAEEHGVFMRKAFLCQAAPPPFQVPPRPQYAKIRKERASDGKICWPLKEMPEYRRDVQQATVCYESTETIIYHAGSPRSNDVFVEQARSWEGYRTHGLSGSLFGFLEKPIPRGLPPLPSESS